jgi:hypothetical protein
MWKTRIRRFRSWWVLTAGVLVIVAAAVYIVMVNERARQDERTIAAIKSLGGMVHQRYSDEFMYPGVTERFGTLNFVYFLGPRVGDQELKVLEGAPELRDLTLVNTRVTDQGIAWLTRFPKLYWLCVCSIDQTKISGPQAAFLNTPPQWTVKGLGALKSLPNLRILTVSGPQVTDADLPALSTLKQLDWIDLHRTSVTKQGVAKLQKALPNCKVKTRR